MFTTDSMEKMYKNISSTQELRAEGNPIGLEVERVEGTLVYLKGHKYPHKGLPTPEAVHAVNIVKALSLEYVKCPFFNYDKIAWKVMSQFILEHEYQTKATQTIRDMIALFLFKIGYEETKACRIADIISHIFEYDQAYRFRVQDLASETSVKALTSYPQKEIKRLLAINEKRDYNVVSKKFKLVSKFIGFALWIPKYKRAFKETVRAVGIKGLQFDENDKYWANMKIDYNYFGQTYEQRNIQTNSSF